MSPKPSDIKIIITSVVHYADNAFNYSTVRSTYSPEERLEQTIDTILSIKRYLPGASIYLVEGGTKDIADKINILDVRYIYTGKNPLIRLTADSRYKGLGEVAIFITSLIQIKFRKNDFIMKISGRYLINANLNLGQWDAARFNFKSYDKSYSTRLYGFDSRFRLRYVLYLLGAIPGLLRGLSIEELLLRIIPNSLVNMVDNLGVEGLVGNYGNKIYE